MAGLRHLIMSRNIVTMLLLIVMAAALSSCSYGRPNARLLSQVPHNAPPNYQQGWKDGCESGMAITGNDFYKTFYRNKISPELMEDLQYSRGWNEAKVYCAHYTMAMQWEGGVLPDTPTEKQQLLPETQSIFTAIASLGPTTLVNVQHGSAEESQGLGDLFQHNGIDSAFRPDEENAAAGYW